MKLNLSEMIVRSVGQGNLDYARLLTMASYSGSLGSSNIDEILGAVVTSVKQNGINPDDLKKDGIYIGISNGSIYIGSGLMQYSEGTREWEEAVTVAAKRASYIMSTGSYNLKNGKALG